MVMMIMIMNMYFCTTYVYRMYNSLSVCRVCMRLWCVGASSTITAVWCSGGSSVWRTWLGVNRDWGGRAENGGILSTILVLPSCGMVGMLFKCNVANFISPANYWARNSTGWKTRTPMTLAWDFLSLSLSLSQISEFDLTQCLTWVTHNMASTSATLLHPVYWKISQSRTYAANRKRQAMHCRNVVCAFNFILS